MPAKNNDPRTLAHAGKTLTLLEWSRRLKIPSATLRARLDKLGWTAQRALSTPADTRFDPGRPARDAVRPCPKLKRHPGGQAYCRWMEGGKRHCRYFGGWGSAAARDAYRKFMARWAEGLSAAAPNPGGPVAVAALVELWLARCKARYLKLGKLTSEYHCHRAACLVLLDEVGATPAAEFGLDQLERVRGAMVRRGWGRKTVNKHVARVVAAFGWGVGRKLVPADVHYALTQLDPLRPGQTAAPDPAPVRSVPADHVAAVLAGPYLDPRPDRRQVLSAMVRFQLATGWRPAQVCELRPVQLDRSGAEWKYTPPPEADKNYHRGGGRPLWVGPRAQAILLPFLDAAAAGEPVFRFARERNKSLLWRAVTPDEYARAVRRACDLAGVPRWHPHQLRHAKATQVKALYESDEAAARAIGTTPDVAARIYADPQEVVDRRIAREAG